MLRKILQINYIDTPGEVFNGNDLNTALEKQGYKVAQIVKVKLGDREWVKECPGKRWNQRYETQRMQFEEKFGLDNVEILCGKEIMQMQEFQEADIVHLHILHNQFISLLDLRSISKEKNVVWTIHDPWIFTGKCIHPLECDKWRTGCGNCHSYNSVERKMLNDKTNEMWRLKKEIISKIKIDFVYSSDFMKRFFEKSPIFHTVPTDRMHKIPFGIKQNTNKKETVREKWNIPSSCIVIGFRYTEDEIKGVKYLMPLLNELPAEVLVLTVGNLSNGKITDCHANTKEFGMCKAEMMAEFYSVCDLFLMPSLAESFGMMALEAMAAECAVVCFQGTVVEENCNVPEVGISVPSRNSESLKNEVLRLIKNPHEIKARGIKGKQLVQEKFKFEEYVGKHLELYHKIYDIGKCEK